MAAKFYESGHPFRYVFFKGVNHGLTNYKKDVNRLILNWFDGYLKNKKKLPNIELHRK